MAITNLGLALIGVYFIVKTGARNDPTGEEEAQ